MKKAVYAGSFDPITIGHTYIIDKASQLFDEVIVSIGINPDKKYMFGLDERKEMLEDISKNYNNVKIDTFENKYLINYAREINANYIIRGIRSQIDFEYEKQMKNINNDICNDIETIFLIPPRDLSDISSSFVKGLIGPESWEYLISTYVPKIVYEKLIYKYSKNIYFMFEVLRSKYKVGINYNGFSSIYNQNTKKYHNLNHVKHCIKEWQEVYNKLHDPEEVLLSLFYHDFIYDPKSDKNEERSVDRFVNDFPVSVNTINLKGDKIKQLIMATKDHIIKKEYDEDFKYMVDIDLAILGSETDVYDEYAKAIRLEYNHVSDEEYKKGRLQFLDSFVYDELEAGIYLTEYFKNKYDKQAFKNILRERKGLQQS
jgi:pantetheine-phosphate adenylyltransferase